MFMALKIWIAVFSVMTPCSLITEYRCFGGVWRPHLQNGRPLSRRIFRKAGDYLPQMASIPKVFLQSWWPSTIDSPYPEGFSEIWWPSTIDSPYPEGFSEIWWPSTIDSPYPDGFSEKLVTFYHIWPLSRRVFVKLVTLYQGLYGIINLNCKIHKSKFAGSIKWVHFCTGWTTISFSRTALRHEFGCVNLCYTH
jgi:hypothetical protein